MMSNHQPPSPPLSTDGSLKRSFSEVSNVSNGSSFLQGQLTPDTSFGYPETDHKLPYSMDIKDPASSGALEHYRTSTIHAPVPRTDYPQLTPVQQMPYRTSSIVTAVRRVEGSQMPDTATLTHSSPVLDNRQEAPKTRVKRAPKTRKPQVAKADREWSIDKPLSEISKNVIAANYSETETFVNRSLEDRMKEVEKRKRIPRPMNSFMLYRKAFTGITKELSSNHQIISMATGESWRSESADVKDFFDKMAQVERENHRKAHPGYKFAPNKNAPKKRRKQNKDNNEGEADDLRFGIATRTKSNDSLHENFQSRTSTPFEQDSSYCSFDSRTPTPFDHAGDRLYQHPDVNRSSWVINNPGRPVPGILPPAEHSHYFQPSVHQSSMGPNIEDVTYRRMNVPGGGPQFDIPGALTGLPGTHHGLLQPQSGHSRSPVSIDDIQVDPQLLEFHGLTPSESDQYAAQQQLDLWQLPQENQRYTHSPIETTMRGHESGDSFHSQQVYQPAFTAAMDGRELWTDDQAGASPTVFDDWLTGQPSY